MPEINLHNMDCIICRTKKDVRIIRDAIISNYIYGAYCKGCRELLKRGTWAYAETIPKRYKVIALKTDDKNKGIA